MKKNPIVTIAIPTYQRPHLLKRCIESVVMQDYENIEVIVSDNESLNFYAKKIVEDFNGIRKIKYVGQEKNIGGIENFFYLLREASGEYFMWLADDDELEGANYVTSLVQILDDDPSVVTAFARWKLMKNENEEISSISIEYKSNYWLFRASKFIWSAKDDFFYGLHRRKYLLRARKTDFFWPNSRVLQNWAYPYLLEMVLIGKIVRSDNQSIAWKNHDYTEKKYTQKTQRSKFFELFSFLARRMNIHILYMLKVKKIRGAFFLPFFFFVSFFSLFKEFVFLFLNKAFGMKL